MGPRCGMWLQPRGFAGPSQPPTVLGRGAYQTVPAGADAGEASLLQVETILRRALDPCDIQARYRPTILRKEGKVPGFDVVLWRRAPGTTDGKEVPPALPPAIRRAG